MKRTLFATLVLAVCTGLLRSPPAPAADSSSIYDTLMGRSDTSILWVAVTEAKETATLTGDDKYTLFAPTDAAFKKLDDATIKKITADKANVKKLLLTHLVMGEYNTTKLKKDRVKELRTLQGTALKVEETKDGWRIGGAKLAVADIPCSNGTVHLIDVVLPTAKE